MYCFPNFLAVVFKKQEISQEVVTRMQDLAFEFSKKIFVGNTRGPRQREGATPSRTQHPARPLAGRGAQAPRCCNPNLGPPQLFSRGCAPGPLRQLHARKLCFVFFHRRRWYRRSLICRIFTFSVEVSF